MRGAKAGAACANNNRQQQRVKAHELMSTRRVRVAAAGTFVDAGIGVRGTNGSKLVLAAERADADEKVVAKLISFFTGCKTERKRMETRVTLEITHNRKLTMYK